MAEFIEGGLHGECWTTSAESSNLRRVNFVTGVCMCLQLCVVVYMCDVCIQASEYVLCVCKRVSMCCVCKCMCAYCVCLFVVCVCVHMHAARCMCNSVYRCVCVPVCVCAQL